MTVPNLMTKMQWIQLHSQFRHAYATVSNALLLLTNDEEQEVPLCYYSTNKTGDHWEGCVAFYEALSKKMKTMTVCSSNAYAKGCIPKYKGQEEVRGIKDEDMSEFNYNCGGYKSTNILKYATTYTLIDGTIIIPYTVDPERWMAPLFLIDINGQKGPNKWGWDLHGFSIYEAINGSLYIAADRNCTYLEKGGKSNEQMMRQTR